MKTFNDLLDLTLREVLENYVVLYNLECGYYYGFAGADDVERLFNNYNINEDYPEAFNVQNIIPDEILTDYGEELVSYSKMERIMKNLDISRKDGELKE